MKEFKYFNEKSFGVIFFVIFLISYRMVGLFVIPIISFLLISGIFFFYLFKKKEICKIMTTYLVIFIIATTISIIVLYNQTIIMDIKYESKDIGSNIELKTNRLFCIYPLNLEVANYLIKSRLPEKDIFEEKPEELRISCRKIKK